MYIPNDSAEERLKKTLFVVEATSLEQLTLWQDHATDSIYPRTRNGKRLFEAAYKWEEINPGWLVTVGKVNKRPVCISVRWVIINGQWVMFWEATSELVDYKLIDKWLEKNFSGKYDGKSRQATCDAANFGHCLSAVDEANKK